MKQLKKLPIIKAYNSGNELIKRHIRSSAYDSLRNIADNISTYDKELNGFSGLEQAVLKLSTIGHAVKLPERNNHKKLIKTIYGYMADYDFTDKE
jgi:hypothetical protein